MGTLIFPMGAEYAEEALFAVKGDPRKLAAVIVQKTGGQTHAPSGGDVGQRGIMVGAVEEINLPGMDQTLLDGLQSRG